MNNIEIIEVRYVKDNSLRPTIPAPVLPNLEIPIPVDTYRKYLLYTDIDGNEKIITAVENGANDTFQEKVENIVENRNLDFSGTLEGIEGDFDGNFREFLENRTHESEVLETRYDLSDVWQNLENNVENLNSENHSYDRFNSNENTFVDELLKRSGLPSPQLDNFDFPKGLDAPGSEFPLPKPDNPIPPSPPDDPNLPAPDPDNPNPPSPDNPPPNSDNPGGWFPWIPPIIRNLFNPLSPLVYDANGDGEVSVVGVAESTAFVDLDNDGFRQRTSWVVATDALFVRDRNGNGFIDNGNELFGNYTLSPQDTYDDSGFTALGYYDENGDNKIDINDPIYGEMQTWQDINQNGISETNELKSLEEAGVKEISLEVKDINHIVVPKLFGGTLLYDYDIFEESSVTLADGTTRVAYDIWFESFRTLSQFVPPEDFQLNPATLTLPKLSGYGVVPDLEYSMSVDGVLLADVENLLDIVSTGNIADFLKSFEKTMLRWAGIDYDFSQHNHSYHGSAHQAAFLEQFLGQPYDRTNPDPVTTYNIIKESLALRFLAQAPLYNLVRSDNVFTVNEPLEVLTYFNYDSQTDQLTLDMSRGDFIQKIFENYQKIEEFTLTDMGLVLKMYKQEFPEEEADYLDEVKSVLSSNNLPVGTVEAIERFILTDYTSIGADGMNTDRANLLNGFYYLENFKSTGQYNDVLLAGDGTHLAGGGGDDNILWNPANGNAHLYENIANGDDTAFAQDVFREDVTISRNNNDALIIAANGSTFTVDSQFSWERFEDEYYRLESVVLEDGTYLDITSISRYMSDTGITDISGADL